MKVLAAVVLALSMMGTFATPTFAVDSSISALCRDGAPEAYSRPGGYCDQIADNKSLLDTKSKNCPPGMKLSENECVYA